MKPGTSTGAIESSPKRKRRWRLARAAEEREWAERSGPVVVKHVVFVNRRSGMAHRRRDCETLLQVPDGALRRVEVVDGRPRFRHCSRCSPPV